MIYISQSSASNAYYVLIFAYIAIIFALSSIPPNEIPEIKTWFPPDKVVHFIEYGIFGLLLTKAFLSSKKLPVKWASLGVVFKVIFITMALGAIDESYQHFTKRTPSLYDWFADVGGATFFMFLTLIFSKSHRYNKYRSY